MSADFVLLGPDGEPDPALDAEYAAKALRSKAAAHEQEAIDSFDRCDTDGFVSQWASGVCASEARLAATIVDNGGRDYFPALFTLDGEFVPAKAITFQSKFSYGEERRWMVLDANGRSTGTFLPYWPKRRSTLAKRGYVEGWVVRYAEAFIDGRGHGLSGTAWAAVRPTDNPWEPPLAVCTTDRWTEKEDK